MLSRLDELEADLIARKNQAEQQGWLGELEGLDLTLSFLNQKRERTQRLRRLDAVHLGMPSPSPTHPTPLPG